MKNLIPLLALIILTAFNAVSAQNGIVRTYYDDGVIESEIAYVNDILDGTSVFYYPNGNVREEIPFSFGKVNGVRKKYFQNGLLKEEKNLREGVLDGLTKLYHENGALKEALNYESGKLIKRIEVPFDSSFSAPLEMYLAGNRQYKISQDANIVSDADISPIPLNGMKEVENNLVYPPVSENEKKEGIVTLSVKIDTAGRASNPEIVKGLSEDYNKSAAEAVLKTKFLPGKRENKPVESRIVLNVEFKRTDQIAQLMATEQRAKEIVVPENKIIDVPVKKEESAIQASNKPEIKKEDVKPAEPVEQNRNAVNTRIEEQTPSENKPYPVGGIERIIARMQIPSKAVELKLEGEIIFQIEVDKYGVVRDTKLVKGLGSGADEAVEVAILESPFRPAREEGKTVRGEITLKIPFSYKK